MLIDGHDIFLEPEEAKRHMGYLPEIPPVSGYESQEYLTLRGTKGIPRKGLMGK